MGNWKRRAPHRSEEARVWVFRNYVIIPSVLSCCRGMNYLKKPSFWFSLCWHQGTLTYFLIQSLQPSEVRFLTILCLFPDVFPVVNIFALGYFSFFLSFFFLNFMESLCSLANFFYILENFHIVHITVSLLCTLWLMYLMDIG